MTEALFDATSVDINAGDHMLRATGRVMLFDGFLVVYREGRDDEAEEAEGRLPELTEGQILRLIDVLPSQHFTQPPPRFTEASLVKALEENGIGRPSTYAPTLSTLVDREYVNDRPATDLPNRHGHGRHRPARRALPADRRPHVHGDDGRGPGRDRPRTQGLARGAASVLRPFERLLEKKDKEITRDDLIKETTEEVCPEVRRLDAGQARPLREVLVLRELPGLQGNASDRWDPASRTARGSGRGVRGMRCADASPPRTFRRVPRLLQVPEVQVRQVEDDRWKMPEMQRGASWLNGARRSAAKPSTDARVIRSAITRCGPVRLDDPCPKCGGTMAPDDERGGVCQSCGHVVEVPSSGQETPASDASSG